MLKKILIVASLVVLFSIILSYMTIGSLLISTGDVCTEYREDNMAAIVEAQEILEKKDPSSQAAKREKSALEKEGIADKESKDSRKRRELFGQGF